MYKRQDIYREIIKDNIDYHILKQDMKFDGDRLDEIVDLMLETVCTARKRALAIYLCSSYSKSIRQIALSRLSVYSE